MKRNKRLLSLLLAVVMIVGMFPLSASAEDEIQTPCEVCSSTEHTTENHVPVVCEVCKGEDGRHTTACPTNCTCETAPAEGEAHAVGCPLNLTPVTTSLEGETTNGTTVVTTTSGTTGGATQGTAEGTTAATTQATTVATETTAATTQATTEATTAPTTQPTDATTAPTTKPTEETTAPTTKPTEAVVLTVYEQLLKAETLDAFWGIMMAEENKSAVEKLTVDEIMSLRTVVQRIFDAIDVPTDDEIDTKDILLETLDVLLEDTDAVILVDTSTFADAMTQIYDIENRVFYLILNRNYYGVTDKITANNNYTSVLAKTDSLESYAKATKEQDIANLTKWLFEPTGTRGEFYVKGLTSGKYMKFNGGQAALVDTGVPTKVYAYTVEGTNNSNETTYLTLYAFVQTNDQGIAYVLNQLGGTGFNGFGGWTDDNGYENDTGNLFLMKEAYYEAPSDIKIVENSTKLNAVIKVFNYDKTVNNGSSAFKFLHGASYGSKMHITPENAGTVDGPEGATSVMAEMSPVLNSSGYPQSNYGSFAYLFDNTYLKGTMEDGGQLFQQKNNYYVYDSVDNAAWYDQTNNKFVLYDLAISPSYTQTEYLDINVETTTKTAEAIGKGKGIEAHASDVQSGNFLPFNKITEDTAYNEGLTQASGQPRYSMRYDQPTDMWFGLTTEFDFYMPENGQKNNEDMIFDFTGDDDVWVYIDDVLILDIGGTHGAYNGSINFATGAVTYKNSNNSDGITTNLRALYQAVADNTSVDTTVRNKVQSILDNGFEGNTFKDFTRHSFNFFYLERGGNISYCRLKFNMDPLPKGALSVEKKTTNINTVYNDGVYEFTITGKDGNGQDIAYPFEYQIVAKATGRSDGKTYKTEDGKFTLKDGQIALFENIEAGNQINVTETGDTLKFASECTVTGSATPTGGSDTSSGNMTFDQGNSHFEVVFTNTIKTYDLSITKMLTNEDNAPLSADTAYSIKLMVQGAPYTGAVSGAVTQPDTEGVFTIKAGDTAIIENIPTGYTYEVLEIGTLTGEVFVPSGVTVPAGFEFRNVSYEKNVSGENGLTEDTLVTVKNTIVAVYGHLTITKDGISDLDNHAGSQTNDFIKEEQQSTIYTISGRSNSGVNVELDVVIVGNESITIKDIPVGTYTVTEKENWSWRYDAGKLNDDDTDTTPETRTAVVEGGDTAEVEFKNDRERIYWLSGDNYLKNLFSAVTAAKPTE